MNAAHVPPGALAGGVTPNRYPSYLEMRQPLPLWVWKALRAAFVVGAIGLITLLFAEPRTGLIAWWLFVLPCVPLLLMLAPGIWRNVCPMASLNQVPRVFGFTRGQTVPSWLARNALLIQATLYFALITTRAPVFDHNGRAVGALMLVALGAAFLGGVVFKGKSGWCGTFCPLMPVQRLYGQTPAVVVPNSHCSSCVGCVTNCLDFNPRLAVVADVQESDAYRLGQLKLFAGAFPGFVLAFFTIPNSVVGETADLGVALPRFYFLTVVYMLVSIGLFFMLDALIPVSPLVLMAAFGAIALNLHNVLRFPTAFHVDKPTWVLVLEYAAVFAVTAQFVIRTFRKERDVAATFEPASADVTVRLGRGSARAGAPAAGSCEVTFEPAGPVVIADRGSTLLEAAERAELPIEAGCRMGVCGADPVVVLEGLENLSAQGQAERSTLARLGLGSSCRLACTARVAGAVRVTRDLSLAGRPDRAAPAARFDADVRRVVIIGNGIAGSTAADHVRRGHPDCAIDLVGDEQHPTYNRMGISRLVYGRSAMSGLQLLPEDWYEQHRITCWLNTQVHEIDRRRRDVVLGTGERLAYDRLILATGAVSARLEIAGLQPDEGFVLRGAGDAIGIRAHAQRNRCRRATVIGGGLLGLEAAFALHQFGLRVTVVQRSGRLLADAIDERGGELLERYFLARGVNIVLGASALAIEGPPAAREVVLTDGSRHLADMVVMCTGITPAVELAAAAGLAIGRGVLVDDHMRTSDPLIYAAGDVAEYAGQVYGLWPVAVAQAEVAAANAIGDARAYDPPPRLSILKGVGLSVTMVGDVAGGDGAESIVRQPSEDEVRYWRLVARDGRLVGAVLLGDWPESAAVVDAVTSGAEVARLLPALQAGDLSVIAD